MFRVSHLFVLALAALSLVSVDAACPSSAPACATKGTADNVNWPTSYSIGFINPSTSAKYCIYQCRVDGTSKFMSSIVPVGTGNEQYWPNVSAGMRYAAWQEVNGVLQTAHIGLTNADRGGREVQCNGSPANQAGAAFTVATAPSGFRRRLLATWSKTIYTKG
jgi:hypothetical protein